MEIATKRAAARSRTPESRAATPVPPAKISLPVLRYLLLLGASTAALMAGLALSGGTAFADGGNGFTNVPNNGIGGVGGVDGSLAEATGQNGQYSSSGTSTTTGSGGGGGVDLTTGNGAPGGAGGTYGTGVVFGTAGVTGSTGQFLTAPTTISTTISGGSGAAGQANVDNVNTQGGGGGGGVGVSATADITISATGIVTGGAGFNQRNAGSGGGGVGVFSSANVTVEAGGQVTGGTGGGIATTINTGRGGGAAAILLTGGGIVQNAGTLTGGNGGVSATNALGSSGGDGGAGVQLLSGGTVINLAGGTITGGAGGAGRNAPASNPPYSPGDGGAGIKGANITIINAGTIAGGAGGTSTGGWVPINGQAIQFTGGVNSLEIWSTSIINGNVVAFSAADTFKLGGSTDSSFDVSQIGPAAKYQGFGLFEKTGASTWTLTGVTTALTPWTISAGVLSIAQDASLGDVSGTVTFNGGTLQTTAAFTSARNMTLNAPGGTIETLADLTLSGVIGGTGALTKTGSAMLTLTGNETYSGETRIAAGTLALTGGGAISSSSRVVADGIFDISGLTGTGTSIQRLAGGGSVNLGAKTLTLTNANDLFTGVISGAGGFTIVAGTQTLSGPNSYSGATTVQNGATLRAGAADTFSAASAHIVQGGGMLDLAGFSQTLASLDNAGTINLGGAPGTVLTVAGDYIGNGGTVQLNASLGGDSSPTDRLVVTGNTSGTSNIRVTNIGGSGAQTTDGIKIIDVQGVSNGTFSLLGDYVFQGQQALVGGAYAYTLQKNGLATPTDGDWYLRSSLINPPPGTPSGPLFQPGVPLYEAYPQILLGLNGLSTMHQRTGGRYDSSNDAFASFGTPADAQGPDVQAWWGRAEGWRAHIEPSRSTSGTGYDTDQARVQTGLDGLLKETDAGRLITSLYLQYGYASSDVRSFYGNGTINVQGYAIGGTLTWLGNDGFYVDAQAQGTLFDATLHSATAARDLVKGNNATGYALGLESGWRIPAGGAWALTPQAQLVYSAVNFNRFNDAFGAPVSLDTGDSLIGRAGLAAEYQSAWRDPARGMVRASVYGITNLYYEFLAGTETNVAGVPFASATDRLWGGIGGGGSYSWNDGKYALYGEALVSTSLSNFSDSYSYKGTAGFRVRW